MIRFSPRGMVAAAALALALAAAPAQAQSPFADKGLGCMAAEYAPDELSTIDRLSPQARFVGGNPNGPANQLGEIAMAATMSCMASEEWTQEEALYAAFYEIGRLHEAAFRLSGVLSADDIARLDGGLAQGDRTRLWEVIESQVAAGMAGGGPGPAQGDAMMMGAFIIGLGLENPAAVAEDAGILLGFMALQRMGRREFLALQDRN